jgi:hypothetical protein
VSFFRPHVPLRWLLHLVGMRNNCSVMRPETCIQVCPVLRAARLAEWMRTCHSDLERAGRDVVSMSVVLQLTVVAPSSNWPQRAAAGFATTSPSTLVREKLYLKDRNPRCVKYLCSDISWALARRRAVWSARRLNRVCCSSERCNHSSVYGNPFGLRLLKCQRRDSSAGKGSSS